jgi:hypothetical protein
MPPKPGEDSFAAFDALLAADAPTNPWSQGTYLPNLDLLQTLLSIPIGQGDKQESGRTAKALDAWIAHEFRRAGFPADAVWPRPRKPRVLGDGMSKLEERLDELAAQLRLHEGELGGRLRPASLRKAIRAIDDVRPGSHEAYILGDFYAKQVDVGLSSSRRGPDFLISTKTMFSSYRNNLRNRHEEAVGEISSLRRRHPMATMGFVFLVRSDIYSEEGSYAILRDILTRLRRAGITFDATMLLVASWDDDAEHVQVNIEQPDVELGSARFFADVVNMVTVRSPIQEHQLVRLRRDGAPVGGMPDVADEEAESPPDDE